MIRLSITRDLFWYRLGFTSYTDKIQGVDFVRIDGDLIKMIDLNHLHHQIESVGLSAMK